MTTIELRVLIVEDESLLATRLASTLVERGYMVNVAMDGERGDLLVNTEQYDAVILDLGLPGIDGLMLLERWRAGSIAVPVLVLTARGSWSEKVRAFEGGADDYVTKPLRIEELLARLHALIGDRGNSSHRSCGRLLHAPGVVPPREPAVMPQGESQCAGRQTKKSNPHVYARIRRDLDSMSILPVPLSTPRMRVLIVEDESLLAERLATTLGGCGYAVDVAADGDRGDFLASTEQYDAVILDLGLPRIDGLTLLERWRAGGIAVPVLVLTARGTWSEKVRGIDGGADDYLTKPFQMEELLARLRALIRRSSRQVTPELRCGAVVLDPRTSQVTVDSEPVKLTSHELRVLSYLMHHSGRIVSQAELTEHIYAQAFDRDSNTVEVFIARLRRKLGASTIETVRGLGYRIAAES